jgi:peroxiredoxin
MPTDLVKVGDAAPDVDVLDTDGRELSLSSFWAHRPAVLVLLRHFG